MRLVSCIVALSTLVPSGSLHAQDRFDEIPSETVARTAMHYPESNERHHQVWYSRIADVGGAYLGVGSMQSFSIAAAQNAELIVVVDYDPVVTRIHRALIPLIARCRDVACLRAALEPSLEETSVEAIEAAYDDTWDRRRTVRTFRVHRPLLARRLDTLAASDTWVSHPGWYERIRRLARSGRIVARIADLTGSRTVRAAGAVSSRVGVPFRVVYLSNAEEYFSYTDDFVANMTALYGEEDAMVLRTFRDPHLLRPSNGGLWHYNAQPLSDFLRRLRDHRYEDSSWLLADIRSAAPAVNGSSYLDASSPSLAQAGPQRWWLSSRRAPRYPTAGGRSSRLLAAYRRAILPTLPRGDRRRLRRIDLRGTGLVHRRPGQLPVDPRTQRSFVLSGEPSRNTPPIVPVPERNLQALLLDSVARDVLPTLFERADRADIAHDLRAAPIAADLYAAYRLRERLLELCDAEPAPGPLGRAMRACRQATELVHVARTHRSLEAWPQTRMRIGRRMRSISSELVHVDGEHGATQLVDGFERLVQIARAVELADAT